MRKLRNLELATAHNKGGRTLAQSILVPEVRKALADWAGVISGGTGVLIGGIAFFYHGKPRTTQDVDFAVLHINRLPDAVNGFKRIRLHAFRHNQTHVEIEVLEPSTVNLSEALFRWIYDESVLDNSLGRTVMVASIAGVIASKLGRFSRRDQADIEDLYIAFGDKCHGVLSAPLNALERMRYAHLISEVDNEQGKK